MKTVILTFSINKDLLIEVIIGHRKSLISGKLKYAKGVGIRYQLVVFCRFIAPFKWGEFLYGPRGWGIKGCFQ